MLRKGPVALSNRFWEAMNMAPARTLRRMEYMGLVTVAMGADFRFATLTEAGRAQASANAQRGG